MVIKINIADKRPTVEGAPVIVCGNSDYSLEFSFDAEWSARPTRTARFVYVQDGQVKHTDQNFTGSTVAVPALLRVRRVLIGVFAGELFTTAPAVLPCEASILCNSGSPATPTPETDARIMELLHLATAQQADAEEAAAQSVKAAAEAAAAVAAAVPGPVIVCTAAGEAVHVSDAADAPLRGLHVYGKTTQDGTPTPAAPVELVNVSVSKVEVHGKNMLKSSVAVGTVSGVIRALKSDGSFVLTGTAAESHGVAVGQLALLDGPYVLSGGTSEAPLTVWGRDVTTSEWLTVATDTGRGVTFEADSSLYDRYLVQYHIAAGKSFAGAEFYPMLRSAACASSAFEPYTGPQTVATSHSLPGIPVESGGTYTDENGQQWVCDEVDFARGVYVERVHRRTFDGTESWKASDFQYDEDNIRYDYADSASPGQGAAACLSAHFPHNGVSNAGMWVNRDRLNYAEFRIMWAYATVDDLKAFLAAQYAAGTPVFCDYVLAEPVETPLTAEELAAYAALRTNKPNTTVLSDAGAGLLLEYVADPKIYIDNKFAELAAMISAE